MKNGQMSINSNSQEVKTEILYKNREIFFAIGKYYNQIKHLKNFFLKIADFFPAESWD